MHNDFKLEDQQASPSGHDDSYQAMEVDCPPADQLHVVHVKEEGQRTPAPVPTQHAPAAPTPRSKHFETRASSAEHSNKASLPKAAPVLPAVPVKASAPARAGPAALTTIVAKGQKGLSYDLDKVTDEKLKRRLIKNRQSAERSRQRKNAHVRELEERLEHSKYEMSALKVECDTLNKEVVRMRELLQRHGISY
jgi:uncharacterized protein HemX